MNSCMFALMKSGPSAPLCVIWPSILLVICSVMPYSNPSTLSRIVKNSPSFTFSAGSRRFASGRSKAGAEDGAEEANRCCARIMAATTFSGVSPCAS